MRWDRRFLTQLDWPFLAALAGLIGIGLMVIASAAHTMPGGERGFLIRQGAAVAVGVASWLIFAGFDYQDFARWRRELYVITVLMLVAVMVTGHSALGAQRWLKLGPLQFQPSELAKLLMIICLASFLADREPLTDWWDLVAPGLYMLIPILLILKQPDLGTALVLMAITVVMLYTAGMPGGRALLLVAGAIALVSFWVYAHLHWHVWIPLKDYQITRLIVFLNPAADPTDTGYHVVQSRIAIGSGGDLGRGWYHGTENQLGFLPEAHTDFIFAVLVEEWGFVGGIATLGLAAFGVTRLLLSSGEVEDRFGRLLVAGVAGMLLFQFVENSGMTMGVMPVAGIPLPFVSYGPSAMITNLAAVGLALGVGMRRKGLMFGHS
jgi:rod shape determining protein RodA